MNAGASMKISNDDMLPNLIVMNTVISAAASGLLVAGINQITNINYDEAIVNERQTQYHYDVNALCNGVLAGLISISACCNNVTVVSATIIGLIGSTIYS